MDKHVYIDLLHQAVLRYADKPCFHVKRGGRYRTWTFRAFHLDLDRLVARLRQNGFRKGNNGIVIGENTPEWVESYFGLVLAGGCAVPVDPNLPPEEIREIVKSVEPGIVFCSQTFLNLFELLRQERASVFEIVLLPSAEESAGPNTFAAFIRNAPRDQDAFDSPLLPEDPMAILFTSGTTGAPKGTVLVQRNFTASAVHGIPRMKVDADTRVLALLPLHHVFGFAGCVTAPLSAGMDIVFLPVIKGPLIIEALREMQVSFLPAVPQMLELFYSNIERNVAAKGIIVRVLFFLLRILSRVLGPALGKGFRRGLFKTVHEGFGGKLDLIVSGGSSLRKKYFQGFRDMGFKIVEGYGLTETFGPITICPADDPRLGSVGPVFPENEMRILNPDKEGRGEVLFRGTTVFAGYYKNEEATKKAFDSEGFFHTGDLGRVSRDGFLYLTGRVKDVIVLPSGKNVYPEELEAFYSRSRIIEEIGVFGVKTENGESTVAVILPSRELRKRYLPGEIRDLIAVELRSMDKHLPSYRKITDFCLTRQPLPRTSTRKIRKPELVRFYEACKRSTDEKAAVPVRLTVGEEELMKTEAYRKIAGRLAAGRQEFRSVRITPRTNLEMDLMMDSLSRIDFLSWLEKSAGAVMQEEALLKMESVQDAVQWMMDANKNLSAQVASAVTPAEGNVAAIMERVRDNRGIVLFAGPVVAAGLSRFFWGFRVHGTENIPRDVPVIFCANHASNLDAAWILSALPWKVRRKTFALGKIELLASPVTAFLVSRCNMVAVEREGDVITPLNVAEKILSGNRNLLIFPEGTRTRTGKTGAFRSGIGMLMIRTGVPVVPVKISGSFDLWPAGGKPRLFAGHARKPTLSFGPACSAVEFGDTDSGTTAERAERISQRLGMIVGEM